MIIEGKKTHEELITPGDNSQGEIIDLELVEPRGNAVARNLGTDGDPSLLATNSCL